MPSSSSELSACSAERGVIPETRATSLPLKPVAVSMSARSTATCDHDRKTSSKARWITIEILSYTFVYKYILLYTKSKDTTNANGADLATTGVFLVHHAINLPGCFSTGLRG